jgi:hypothetical protein
MYLTKRNLYYIIGAMALVIIILALPGCGVIRDLPKYW